jgi:O-antigen/teichoic acid export membrane protein
MSFFKRSIFLASGKTLQAIVTLVFSIVLSHLLSKFYYGTYQQVILVGQIIIPIFILGLPTAIFFFLPKFSGIKRDKFLSSILTLFIFMSFLSALTIYIIAINNGYIFKNNKIVTPLLLYSIFIASRILTSSIDPFLISQKKEKVIFYYYSFITSLDMIFITIFYFTKMEFINLFIFYAILGIIQILLTFFIINRYYKFKFRFIDIDIFKEVMTYSLPIAGNSIIGILSCNIDKLIISSFLGASIYAVYINGSYQIPLLSLFIASIVSVISPAITNYYHKKEHRKIIDIVRKSIEKTSIIIIPLFFLLMVVSREFITTLYSDKFSASVNIFRITLILLPFRVTNYGNILNLIGKSKIVFYITLFELILNTILSIILLNIIGIYGPAISIVCTTIIQIALLLYFISLSTKTGLLDIFPVRNIVFYISFSIISVIPLFIVKRFADHLTLLVIEVLLFISTFSLLYLIWRKFGRNIFGLQK